MKSSRKYADFYSSMCLKTESKSDKVLAIALEKLKLDNVETWCMIHNLYKCFCKCIFTDNSVPNIIGIDESNGNNFVQKIIYLLKSQKKMLKKITSKHVRTLLCKRKGYFLSKKYERQV